MKESAEQVPERRTLGHLARDSREVNVPRPVLLVAEVALRLENAEQRSHCCGMRRFGQPRMHLGSSRTSESVDHVHDLSLSAAERSSTRWVAGGWWHYLIREACQRQMV